MPKYPNTLCLCLCLSAYIVCVYVSVQSSKLNHLSILWFIYPSIDPSIPSTQSIHRHSLQSFAVALSVWAPCWYLSFAKEFSSIDKHFEGALVAAASSSNSNGNSCISITASIDRQRQQRQTPANNSISVLCSCCFLLLMLRVHRYMFWFC